MSKRPRVVEDGLFKGAPEGLAGRKPTEAVEFDIVLGLVLFGGPCEVSVVVSVQLESDLSGFAFE